MITSILQSPLSSPQEKTKTQKSKVIETTVEDDDHKVFDLEIIYDYTPYYGLGWEISVWNYDYKTNGTPNIGQVDLHNWIKDCIRENHNCHVTFY